jgi:hypothetical protein
MTHRLRAFSLLFPSSADYRHLFLAAGYHSTVHSSSDDHSLCAPPRTQLDVHSTSDTTGLCSAVVIVPASMLVAM